MESNRSVPSYGADRSRPSSVDRRGPWVWSRGKWLQWRRAGCVVLPLATARAGSLVLLLTRTAALESATVLPLALTIAHPGNRLTASGAAVARLATARLRGWFMTPWPVAHGTRGKNFCCVTTGRCNLGWLRWLWRRCGASARTFFLGMLGFGRLVLASFGLPSRRLPAPDQAEAFGVLAVTLIPTPRLVLASAAFAQADPRPRSSRTGRTGAGWTIMMVAHGSLFSQGTARGERANALLGRLFETRKLIYPFEHEPDREGTV
jgi:hypothetical protein